MLLLVLSSSCCATPFPPPATFHFNFKKGGKKLEKEKVINISLFLVRKDVFTQNHPREQSLRPTATQHIIVAGRQIGMGEERKRKPISSLLPHTFSAVTWARKGRKREKERERREDITNTT